MFVAGIGNYEIMGNEEITIKSGAKIQTCRLSVCPLFQISLKALL